MIANERQYRISQGQLRRFEEAIAAHDAREPRRGVDPRVHRAMREALASEAEELREQIGRYEDLKSGRVTERTLDSLRELPTALIEARIAANMTQKALAQRIGVPEQQVQRWEANRYAGVGVDRLQTVADALRVRIRETVSYAPAA